MPIIVSEGSGSKTFAPHPEGAYTAVCVDVVDLGFVETSFGTKHKVRIVFYAGEDTVDSDNKTVAMLLFSRFTASLHEKANLRTFLQSWRGRPFTEEELHAFDLESLVGAPALVQVMHNKVGDKTYANITSIMRLPKGQKAPAIPSEYIRAKDRDEQEPEPQPVKHDDDDLPF